MSAYVIKDLGGKKERLTNEFPRRTCCFPGLTTARGTQSPNPRVTLGPWRSGDQEGRYSLGSRLRPIRPHSWYPHHLTAPPLPLFLWVRSRESAERRSPLACSFVFNSYLFNPEYSLEGLVLRLTLQYFGHLMWRANLLEKTLMLGKIEGRRRSR